MFCFNFGQSDKSVSICTRQYFVTVIYCFVADILICSLLYVLGILIFHNILLYFRYREFL